ncbi:MAG TPA: hypothetical protein VF025_07490 [Gaiellaceae bacterium]
MLLVLLDAAVGILLLTTIGLAAASRRRVRSQRLRVLGFALVAVPLPLAVALHLTLRLPGTADQAAFLAGVAAFALGAALVLRADEGDDWGEEHEDDSPPWWPAFEREFRVYARTSPPRRRSKVGT